MDLREASVAVYAEEPDCTFCSPEGRSEWFNTPITSDEDKAFVVPSVGSLVPGYLLAIPVLHVTATCRIPEDEKERFASFVETIRTRLEQIYKSGVTLFEHSACGAPQQARSACISHAHLHLVPGSYDLASEAPQSRMMQYASLRAFIEGEHTSSYLMLQDPGGPVIASEDPAIPQFFRRLIAKRLGIAEAWDFALFPFFANVRQTYHDFDVKLKIDSL